MKMRLLRLSVVLTIQTWLVAVVIGWVVVHAFSLNCPQDREPAAVGRPGDPFTASGIDFAEVLLRVEDGSDATGSQIEDPTESDSGPYSGETRSRPAFRPATTVAGHR